MEKPGASRFFWFVDDESAYLKTRSLVSWVPIWVNTDAVCEADVTRKTCSRGARQSPALRSDGRA